MKHFKFYLFLIWLCQNLAAETIEVTIGVLKYYLDTEAQTAEVSGYTSDCKDNVTIPTTVENAGVAYNVTSLGFACFQNNDDITNLEIPNSVTAIGKSAFDSCTGLTSITIPNSITTIGDEAFDGCIGLTSITIGNSVTSIGNNNAFDGCSSLESISVSKENTVYDSRDSCNAIIETATNNLVAGCKSTIIPNSVTKIGNYAFSYCWGLTNITIPNSVTSIGNGAFYNCMGLRTSIIIPSSVTEIGSNAFFFCPAWEITSLSTTPPSIDYDTFIDATYVFGTLYVPMGSADAYKSAYGWESFSNIVEGVPTAIKPITSDGEKPTVIYDLEGRRLRAPQKGINIINGRKVLVR